MVPLIYGKIRAKAASQRGADEIGGFRLYRLRHTSGGFWGHAAVSQE